MERLWSDLGLEKSPNMLKNKTKLVQVLVGANGMPSSDLELSLRRLVATVKTCPSYALFLMQGSDFWDALLDAWRSGAGTFRSKIMATIYYSLTSLLQSDNSNLSLLLDHLFDLLADDGKSGQVEQGLLLTDLVCATPFLRKFRSRFDAALSTGRSKSMLQSLESVRATSMQGNLQSNRRRIHQQKGKKPSPHQPDVQKMSLVTEVRDLFPDLSASTVIELLDRFGDDVEKVVAHLLDNQPVSNADNVAESNINLHSVPDTPDLAVTSTSSSQRRNYFDRDELDKLEVAASRLHIGHKETTWEPSSSQNKAAIFSALAAFDSDSDERDDTYDIDDVGGAIDNTIGAESEAVSNEDSLYVTWKSSPEVFARDAATRRGKARAMLRNDTGMTDEAIEGWALMLGRDPRRQAKLETRSSSFRGEQAELSATAWRAKGEDTVEDHAGANTQSSDRGNLRGRGRGRGHGSAFRGNAAGPTGEKDTQLARQRKDANKGSRANHNRRNQRAKKLARAGFPG
ncbi:hypothetical protein MMC10_007668 [Thelotrema lepadinum]|nr:hypothetical protein [Thelotrema lepadinum]